MAVVTIPSHGAAIRTCRAAEKGSQDALEALKNVHQNGIATNNAEHMVLRIINNFLSSRGK